LDIHRKQLKFDWVDKQNGKWERGRIAPADRDHLADWLIRFDGVGPVGFAMEGCTGWRYIAEEMSKAGVTAHLAEPADTSALRGPMNLRPEAAEQVRQFEADTPLGRMRYSSTSEDARLS
jgi:transposase